MKDELISRKEAYETIYKRLFEVALSNINVKCYADEVCVDIAEHVLKSWIEDIPANKSK
jgi:hypothetical protein